MNTRHPEKVNNPTNPIKKKPDWIRTKIIDTQNYFKTKEIINKNIGTWKFYEFDTDPIDALRS